MTIDKGAMMQGASTDLPDWDDATPEQREGFALAIKESVRDGSLLAKIARDEQAAKNAAYGERDRLVALLTTFYPSWLGLHPADDVNWEPGWRTIVYIETPAGQLSWHIADREVHLFEHLRLGSTPWDEHTTEQKYARIEHLVKVQSRPRLGVSVGLTRMPDRGRCEGCGHRRVLYALDAVSPGTIIQSRPHLCSPCAGLRPR